jgi:integrase/recombinase XerD
MPNQEFDNGNNYKNKGKNMKTKKPGRPFGITGKARAITDEELRHALQVTAQGFHHKRNVAMLVLSNYLGLRAKELAALKIADVYDGSRINTTLRLFASYTKGHKHRDLSLGNPTVIQALEAYLARRQEKDGALFNLQAPLFRSERGCHYSPTSMSRAINIMYQKAGLTKASSHTGRRSMITKLAYKGIDIYTIMRIAGHSSITTTIGYIQDDVRRQEEALRRL